MDTINDISLPDFGRLTPEMMIGAVEDALGIPFTSLAAQLPSYINRVYEFQAEDGTRYIAKFYRPGRWTKEAIEDEHSFVLACAEDEIPVIPPIFLKTGKTVAKAENAYFAVYPKRSGRELELSADENWLRLGTVIARMHNAGARQDAPHRMRLHPAHTTAAEIRILLESGLITGQRKEDFRKVTEEILEEIMPLFDNVEYIRIHGDCHRANILERPGEGIMIIDFDDMMTGPPAQDLWLLLPGHITECTYEIDLLIEGYEQFRDFDDSSIRLVEPLRAMRIIYFLAWCARQIDDFKFRSNFPEWGTDSFWQTEINDLATQLQVIRDSETVITRRDTPAYIGRILTDH